MIDVQKLLGLPDSTRNPHLWYKPQTMPAVANAVAADLSALAPAHAAYFRARAASFQQSLAPWKQALERFAAEYPGTRSPPPSRSATTCWKRPAPST